MFPQKSTDPVIIPPLPTPAPTSSDITHVVTPEGVGIRIDDVDASLWKYLRTHKLWHLILLVPFIVAWEAFCAFLLIADIQDSSSSSSRGIGDAMALPIVLLGAWIYKIKRNFQHAFFEQFAISNGYTFTQKGAIGETYGAIFRQAGTHTASDIVVGKYQDNSMRLFLHEWRLGRDSHTNTVIEIDLQGQLPNLLMVNKKSQFTRAGLVSTFRTKNTFSLEGDFDQHFTLYGEDKYRIEALQVFDPEIMALMMDESKQYSVEFVNDRIYIYANSAIDNTRDITQAFALAKRLVEEIGPVARRLEKHSDILPAPVNVVQKDELNRWFKWMAWGTLGLVVLSAIVVAVYGLIAYKDAALSETAATETSLNKDIQQTIDNAESIADIQSDTNLSMKASDTIRAIDGEVAVKNTPSSLSQMTSVIAYQWLWNLQQGNFDTAYGLEDPSYQKASPLAQQRKTLKGLYPKGYAATYKGEKVVQQSDGSQVVSIYHKVTDPTNDNIAPSYIEVLVINNNGVVGIFGENHSPNPFVAQRSN